MILGSAGGTRGLRLDNLERSRETADSRGEVGAYGFFVDEQAAQMTVVAIHPDAASMEYHMEIGGPRFRRFADLLQLRSIDVYGEPSETVLEQLRKKAEMLGEGGGLAVHRLHAGFVRFGAAAPGAVT